MGKKGSAKATTSSELSAVEAPAATTESKEKPRHTCLHSQLHKTKFCLYHLKGACQFGENCSFAHSCAELQATPDLRQTRLCIDFFEGAGCNNPNCTYAHCEEDLRSTDMFYKKTLCIWNEKGKCRNGDQCRFAHGLTELRANQGSNQGSKEKLISDHGLGRQISSHSGTTAGSSGAASTMSSLSGLEDVASGSSTGASVARNRQRGARGKRGGGQAESPSIPGQQVSREQALPSGGYAVGEVMPMKILPARNFAPNSSWGDMPTSAPVSSGFERTNEACGSAVINDPALEVELNKLRSSLSALTARCNQINDHMYTEEAMRTESNLLHEKMYAAQALLSQVALRQQLLSQMEQVRREQNAASMIMPGQTGAGTKRVVPPSPVIHTNGVNWNFDLQA